MTTTEPIRRACAKATGYPEERIFSKERTIPLPWIRACAVHLARKHGFKWAAIADELNLGNHSSAVAAEMRFLARFGAKSYEIDTELYRRIENVLKQKKNGLFSNEGV